MRPFRLALAQINTVVGDLAGNGRRILDRITQARDQGVDLIVFPELAVTGYPPEDLLLKPDFVHAAGEALQQIVPATRGLTAIVGCPRADDDLYNSAAVLHDGRLVAYSDKQYLPNYGVFDEDRYFAFGQQRLVFASPDVVFGINICEDLWYADGPSHGQAAQGGAQLLINLSASPYYQGKGALRERLIASRAADSTAVVAYCNLVGGQDELVFDGQSLVCGPRGDLLARAGQFVEELLIVDLDLSQVFRTRLADPRRRKQPRSAGSECTRMDLPALTERDANATRVPAPRVAQPLERVAEVYEALVLATRDYVHKNGFRSAVLGLSGGVDSALTAAIAADALGPEHVTGVAMPTRYSSGHSRSDARELAENLRIRFFELSIDAVFQQYLDLLGPVFAGRAPGLAEENLQPRIRGTLLMALSNHFGWLVLTTGNKSETGVGYSTLYGDTAGGFAVLKDVPKQLVYELSRYSNTVAGRERIPRSTLDKAPSAELRPNQKDTDALPPYHVLDPILHAYIEENRNVPEIVSHGFDEATVREVIRLVDRNEYKRRQSPPGVKITPRAFGKDWRLPITNAYRQPERRNAA